MPHDLQRRRFGPEDDYAAPENSRGPLVDATAQAKLVGVAEARFGTPQIAAASQFLGWPYGLSSNNKGHGRIQMRAPRTRSKRSIGGLGRVPMRRADVTDENRADK